MFTGFSEDTISFFLDLKFHNNAAYFHENHDRYVEVVQRPFYEFIEDLGPAMRKIDPMYWFELGPSRLDWGMGFWGENREALDLFRKRMRANPDGTLAMLDDLDLAGRGLLLNGSIHKRMEVPPEIPDRLRRWYCTKEMYINKISPDFRKVFSERILTEVRKDFQQLAPLYHILRGYCDELDA